MPTPQEILDRYYYKGWNKADESVIRECLAEDVKFQLAFEKRKKRGHESFLSYMRATHDAIGRNMIEMEDVVVNAEGTKAAVRLTCRGLHKGAFFGVEASGHEISWSATAFITFANDRIAEIWVLADLDSLKRQIGASTDSSAFSS